MKGLEAFKNQHKFPAFSFEEDEDYFDEDEDEDDYEEDELQFLREKAANQLNLLRQQAIDANNATKGIGAIAAAASNNGKMNNNVGNGNAGKKGNPNQNMGMKPNPGGIDQKTMAALKLNNPHLGGVNINPGEVKRGNDINAMMGLTGYHGNGVNIPTASAAAAALGGNSNGLGGFQIQPNNGFNQGSSTGFPNGGLAAGHQHPSSMLMNMNGYHQNNHPSSMMMNMQNLQNRHAMQQQPQMMYQRSPFIPPSTGYYYNYCPSPYSYTYPNHSGGDHSASHMFSDENTSSSCSIM
ncbi:hypothetical protein L1049_005566 [Liquidambar formosana]|uniref:Uncharacterized protein n=1 Tax=Liquidambar formosana TaxID=63359 RepID=A0AAP0RFI9_LIQFO